MGRRPTPNPRRGMFRAAITVIVLTALLIIAILVVSSLSAPSAKAPTTPLTPGPITPVTTGTPQTTTTVRTTAHPTSSPTAKTKKLGSLHRDRPEILASLKMPKLSLLERAAAHYTGGIAVESHRNLAWFVPGSGESAAGSLLVRTSARARVVTVGRADPFVKPVWSHDGRYLLYVTASQVRTFPGARWTLAEYDSRTQRVAKLAALPGTSMTPLGWWHARPLFLVATTSDTSLYTVAAGTVHFVSVLAPQVITSAALSPGLPIVAFAAPTNCYNCTLEFYSLRTFTEWNGPTGIANESEFTWSRDGRQVATMMHGRIAIVAASPGARVRAGALPSPAIPWNHSLNVSLHPGSIRMMDRVDGRATSIALDAAGS